MAHPFSFSQVTKSSIRLLLAVAIVTLSCGVAGAQGKKKREIGPKLVRTETVERKPKATLQKFVGTLQPVRRSVIGSAVEERVDEVLVEEGDFVAPFSPGQAPVLVQLRLDTIDIECNSAGIELELRKKTLEELSTTIPTQIEAAQAEVARVQAELDFARQVYDRLKGLAASGSMSPRELEEAASRYNASRQALAAARAEWRRLESTREVRMAIARHSIASQQAEVERVTDLKSRYSVTAPFSGFVTRRMVEKGTWVTRGTPLVELVQLDPIELRILVPQEYSIQLQQSFDAATEEQPLKAEILIDSVSGPLTGKVVRIIPDADPRTRSLPVVIQIDNPASSTDGMAGHLLKPGLLAEASLEIGRGQLVKMVPKDALVLNQGAASIYVVDHSGDQARVREEPVKTGRSNGNWIEISGKIEEGDEVVVQGNERLRNGESVTIMKQRQAVKD